jgi:hypothetical protein
MVEQPIEKCCGHHTVAHHLRPGLEALVGGDNERSLLVELADHIEKQIGLSFFDRGVADLIDDDKLRLHDPSHPVLGCLLDLGCFEQFDEVRDPLEADLVAFLNSRLAKGDGKMRKAGADPSHRPIIEEEAPFVPSRGWAEMIKKVYELDPLLCPSCGGKMTIVSFIKDHKVIDKIICHLKLTFEAERPPPPRLLQQELLMAAEESGEYF